MRPKKQILLVSANEDRAGVLKYMLETNGYAVTAVGSAAEALAALAAWPCWRLCELLLCELPLDGAAQLFSRARQHDGHMQRLALAYRLREVPEDLDVDRILHGVSTTQAELLECVKLLTARKRGPRKGYKMPPATAEPAAAEIARPV